MTGSNTISTVCSNCAIACGVFWLALAVQSAPGAASFTASFQPCVLPSVAVGSDGVLARCEVEFAGRPGSVELVGQAPNHVREAVFRNEGNQVIQRIAVSARPFIDPENVSIIVRDMNFDGWPDFGLRDFARTGANEPWQFWLWEAARSRFVFHSALSRLPNPEVSKASKVVRAHVMDDDSNVTTITYKWYQGELVEQGAERETAR